MQGDEIGVMVSKKGAVHKLRSAFSIECKNYFFIIEAFSASAFVMPFMVAHSPLATYFHSPASLSNFDMPAQLCEPDKLAQSFLPAAAMPKHFSFSCAITGALTVADKTVAKAAALMIDLNMVNS
jgi:hypothetical protein